MSLVMPLVTRCLWKGAGSLATGSAVVSDLLNVALFFESDLHTLHFELKTDKTREMMDSDAEINIKKKSISL